LSSNDILLGCRPPKLKFRISKNTAGSYHSQNITTLLHRSTIPHPQHTNKPNIIQKDQHVTNPQSEALKVHYSASTSDLRRSPGRLLPVLRLTSPLGLSNEEEYKACVQTLGKGHHNRELDNESITSKNSSSFESFTSSSPTTTRSEEYTRVSDLPKKTKDVKEDSRISSPLLKDGKDRNSISRANHNSMNRVKRSSFDRTKRSSLSKTKTKLYFPSTTQGNADPGTKDGFCCDFRWPVHLLIVSAVLLALAWSASVIFHDPKVEIGSVVGERSYSICFGATEIEDVLREGIISRRQFQEMIEYVNNNY